MLKKFIINMIIIILLCIVFEIYAEPLDSVVAVVNDEILTYSELNTQLDNVRKQMIAKGVQPPDNKILSRQVLQHLIDVNLQLQIAKQHNILIDSTELNNAINKIAESNKLTLTELRAAIEQQGLSWKLYRNNIKKEIIMHRLQQNAVGKDVTVVAKQVDDYLKNSQDKSKIIYHLQNILIPLPEEPSSEELQQAQKQALDLLRKIKHGDDFAKLAIMESTEDNILNGGDLGDKHLAELPEIFAKKVINMKVGDTSGPLRTGNGLQFIKLVSMHTEIVQHEITKTHVRHILLKPAPSMTADEVRKQADNLYQQLQSGEDFAKLAKKYSLDVNSAIKGGDLGWLTNGEVVPEFEKIMNELPLHKISKPVKTMFGLHIIEVLERKTEDDTSLYERQQAQQFLQQQKFAEATQNWLQNMRSEAYIKILDKQLA